MASYAQSKLLPILIILLGFGLGFFYNNQADPTASIPPVELRYEISSLHGLDTLNINYSVLTNDQFRQLQVFGDLPVQPAQGGKTNPFQ